MVDGAAKTSSKLGDLSEPGFSLHLNPARLHLLNRSEASESQKETDQRKFRRSSAIKSSASGLRNR
jgi:hypothetical protein